MTETSSRSLIHRLSTECSILAIIVCVTMLLMNIRAHERYVEHNRSVLRYSTDVDKPSALRLMNELRRRGLLDGERRAFSLSHPDAAWELGVFVSEATLLSPRNQQLLKEFLVPVCQSVFGDDPVRVSLTDEDLIPQLLLMELPE